MGDGQEAMSKQGFKGLQVWRKAKTLAVDIYLLTNDGKVSRDFGSRDQLRRCAVSIPSNIAEGDERDTDKDSVRFFYMAKGSLAELITQLEIGGEVCHFTKEQIPPLVSRCEELGRMLGALIKARSAHRP